MNFHRETAVHVHHDQHLNSYNTLALASTAQCLVYFEHLNQIPALQALAQDLPQRWILGGGSNMVMAPHVSALVVKMQNQGVRLLSETDTEVIVEAQAGESWHQFVRLCLENGWFGLENLALIPGTVGAAPVQNIGAYGVELEQRLHLVQVWDFLLGKRVNYSVEQCQFAYRESIFKREKTGRYMIVAVQFKLMKSSAWQPVLRYPDLLHHASLQKNVTAHAVFEAVVEIRQRKLPDPQQLANAGSFFKNPIVDVDCYERIRSQHPQVVAYAQEQHMKLAAGWLIEQSGWKGKRMGPVGMHMHQALVLVNYGGATATDVQCVVDQVKTDVYNLFQVELEQEPVNMV